MLSPLHTHTHTRTHPPHTHALDYTQYSALLPAPTVCWMVSWQLLLLLLYDVHTYKTYIHTCMYVHTSIHTTVVFRFIVFASVFLLRMQNAVQKESETFNVCVAVGSAVAALLLLPLCYECVCVQQREHVCMLWINIVCILKKHIMSCCSYN